MIDALAALPPTAAGTAGGPSDGSAGALSPDGAFDDVFGSLVAGGQAQDHGTETATDDSAEPATEAGVATPTTEPSDGDQTAEAIAVGTALTVLGTQATDSPAAETGEAPTIESVGVDVTESAQPVAAETATDAEPMHAESLVDRATPAAEGDGAAPTMPVTASGTAASPQADAAVEAAVVEESAPEGSPRPPQASATDGSGPAAGTAGTKTQDAATATQPADTATETAETPDTPTTFTRPADTATDAAEASDAESAETPDAVVATADAPETHENATATTDVAEAPATPDDEAPERPDAADDSAATSEPVSDRAAVTGLDTDVSSADERPADDRPATTTRADAARATSPTSVDAPPVAAPTAHTPALTGHRAPVAPTEVPLPQPDVDVPDVHDQIVRRVSELRELADGGHEMVLELEPMELGRVRLEVVVNDGRVDVKVHADQSATRQLLADSLADLRAALDGSGLRSGDLDVGGRDSGDRRGPSGSANGAGDDDVPNPTVRRRPIDSSARLDVLL